MDSWLENWGPIESKIKTATAEYADITEKGAWPDGSYACRARILRILIGGPTKTIGVHVGTEMLRKIASVLRRGAFSPLHVPLDICPCTGPTIRV